MNLEAWTGWVTLIGAVVAAVTGSVGLWMQVRGKRDSFKIGIGTVSPEATSLTFLNVVSRSDHPIKISDYGFIEGNGRLYSIPMESDLGNHIAHEGVFRGSSMLEGRGDFFEIGYDRTRPVIGCFAMSNLQSKPKLAFSYETPRWKRLKVRLQTLRKAEAYLL